MEKFGAAEGKVFAAIDSLQRQGRPNFAHIQCTRVWMTLFRMKRMGVQIQEEGADALKLEGRI